MSRGPAGGYGRRPPNVDELISLKVIAQTCWTLEVTDTLEMPANDVNNISYRTTNDDLRRTFERYGEIGDIHIPRDPYTRQSKGFGFVRYYSKRDADYALERCDGKQQDGRELRVSHAAQPRDDYRGSRDRRRSPRSRSRSPRRRSSRGERNGERSPSDVSRSRSPAERRRSKSRSGSR